MPKDRAGKGGDYKVGYGRPPEETRFRKGHSGNPKGRPKSRKSGKTDIGELLNEPVEVKVGGEVRKMSTFEASVWRLARKALDGDFRAILKFIKLCEEYGVIAPPADPTGGGVIRAPKGVNFHAWLESVTEEVPVDEI